MLIIDSHCLGYIAKHTTGFKLSHEGIETGIIFGFLHMLLVLMEKFKTNEIVFAWDSRSNLRKQLYSEYKANRHKNKTEEQEEINAVAYEQFTLLRTKIIPMLGFRNNFIQTGIEADDIIACCVHLLNDKTNIVVSTDKDLFQLLNFCQIHNPVKNTMMTHRKFCETFEITPLEWPKYKALVGDVSDNIKGIQGIGPKTALEYLQNNLKPSSKKYILIENEENAWIIKRNLQLMTLPIQGTKLLQFKPNEIIKCNNFQDLCDKYGFNSFLNQPYLERWAKALKMEQK